MKLADVMRIVLHGLHRFVGGGAWPGQPLLGAGGGACGLLWQRGALRS